MDFQEFGDILRKIDKTLIHFEDVSGNGNKRGRLGKYTVLRPSYSKASEHNQEIIKIREKSTELENELEEFHKTLPNYSTRRKYTPKLLPFPVTICHIRFDNKIFYDTLGFYGRDNFVAIFNKTIKEYIENKIVLAKINKIELHKIDKYKQQIIKLDTWFNEFDFVPDKIKSFIDEVKDQIKNESIHANESKLIYEGATWSITYNNIPEKTVKDTIGMHIIAHLIKCQGDIIRADEIYKDVVADIKPECYEYNDMHNENLKDDEMPIIDGKRFKKIDLENKRHIIEAKETVQKLEEKLTVAENENNIPRQNEIKTQIKLLKSYLSISTDKYGNPRKMIDHIEKARKAIIQSVNTAKRNIKPIHPQFYDHLEKNLIIRKESYYKPNTPIKWTINR